MEFSSVVLVFVFFLEYQTTFYDQNWALKLWEKEQFWY